VVKSSINSGFLVIISFLLNLQVANAIEWCSIPHDLDIKDMEGSVKKIIDYGECERKDNSNLQGTWSCIILDGVNLKTVGDFANERLEKTASSKQMFSFKVDAADQHLKQFACSKNLGVMDPTDSYSNICLENYTLAFNEGFPTKVRMTSTNGYKFNNDSEILYLYENRDVKNPVDNGTRNFIIRVGTLPFESSTYIGKCHKVK
jgi:hypothetical protein